MTVIRVFLFARSSITDDEKLALENLKQAAKVEQGVHWLNIYECGWTKTEYENGYKDNNGLPILTQEEKEMSDALINFVEERKSESSSSSSRMIPFSLELTKQVPEIPSLLPSSTILTR